MSNTFNDYELDKDAEPSAPPPRESHTGLIAGVVLIVIAIAVGWYVMRDGPAGVQESAAPAPEATEPAAAIPEIDLPPLDQTDELVRTLATGLSSHPLLVKWLATDQVLRRFTAVVDNIAYGRAVRNQLTQVAPTGAFRVTGSAAQPRPDPRNYARYDTLAGAMDSIEPIRAAQMYGMLQPRLEEAYRELGRDVTFDSTFQRAIVALMQTPPLRGDEALVRKEAMFLFSNPGLESLTPAQKHLLRMGPENVTRVQAKLRDIALALGIPRDRLP
jgi:hypothetical protein